MREKRTLQLKRVKSERHRPESRCLLRPQIGQRVLGLIVAVALSVFRPTAWDHTAWGKGAKRPPPQVGGSVRRETRPRGAARMRSTDLDKQVHTVPKFT